MKLKIIEQPCCDLPDEPVGVFLSADGHAINMNLRVNRENFMIGWITQRGSIFMVHFQDERLETLKRAGFEFDSTGVINIIK